MRKRITLFLISLSALMLSSLHSQEPEHPRLTGPYLGQSPPGPTPEVFAPGIVSRDADIEHSAAIFSPDGTEVFWNARRNMNSDQPADDDQRLYYMRLVDGTWTPPEIAPFDPRNELVIQRPVFAPDGNRIYFELWNVLEDAEQDIYFVERVENGWSEMVPVSPQINSPAIERLHFVAADGSMYFTRNFMTPHEEIFVSRFVNGAFSAPESLGEDFNTPALEGALVLAPDESYMLTCQSRSYRDPPTVYISYKGTDNTWSDRVDVGFHCGGFLALSPDGNYLFLVEDEILWVDTSFVEELKQEPEV